MRKPCGVCGRIIPYIQTLCWECLDEHGVDTDKWPAWVEFAVRDNERDWQQRISKDELEYNDDIDYRHYRAAEEDGDYYIPAYGDISGDSPWDVGQSVESIYGSNMVYD